MNIKKNDEFIVNIIDYGANGEGIAKINNFTIFVRGALKGEECKIHILKVKTHYGYGKVIDIIKPSPERVIPDCQFYNKCGGCNLRHMNYEETLRVKREKVVNLVKNNLDLPETIVKNTIGMNTPFYYRNKTIFPVSKDKKIGFYSERTHNIIEIENCKIQSKYSLEIAQYVAENFSGTIYDEKTGKGLLRNIMIRHAFSTNEVMIVLVQTSDEVKFNIEKIIKKYPIVKTIIVNINNKNTNVVLSNQNKVIYGSGYITDKINGYSFRISANSFFQVNTEQTKIIYDTAIKEANLNASDTLCDLYCGTGTIGICASKYVKKVIGIEIVEQAINDAKINAKINNVKNVEFINGDVEKAFENLIKKNLKPDAVIVDPPRRGLDKKTVENLNNLELQKLVYISCNPATLVRDLKQLSKNYNIKKIQPIDNFPYTSHVECLAVLELKNNL